MTISTAAALLSCLVAAGPETPATFTPAELPRPRFHDATGSNLAASVVLDWDAIKRPAEGGGRGRANAATTEIRRNYVYVEDTDNTIRVPASSNQDLNDWFNLALRETYRVLPDEFIFTYMFTSFDTNIPAYFYAPQANDVAGIGQQRYDNNGRGTPLEGYVFMNYWREFQNQYGMYGADVVRGFSRSVFNQEAGHRWISGFERGAGGGDATLAKMIGRMGSHWSYFMHSSASPMEGNSWRDNMNGSFTTTTDYNNWYYNDLDLYFMGLKRPAEVQPWFVIDAPQVGNARDLTGAPPNASSPPQIIQRVTVNGTRLDMNIQMVLDKLGARNPAPGFSPTKWRAVFIMLATPGTRLSAAQKLEFERLVDDYATGFRTGTGQRGELDYVLMAPPKQPFGGPCQNASDCDPSAATVCALPNTGSPLCSTGCLDDSSCPQGYCCGMDMRSNTAACQPEGTCPAPQQPDAGFVDGGEPQMSGGDGGTTQSGADAGPPGACECDNTYACDPDCACDPECVACTCDTTYGCDDNCLCDPECNGGSRSGQRPAESGCGCTTASAPEAGAWGMFAFAALLLARRRARR